MQNYQSDNFGNQRDVAIEVQASRSKLATWSILCSVMVFAPLVPLTGAVLGLFAQRELRNNVARKGGGFADWALVLGVLLTAVQAFVGIKAYELAMTLNRGPESALIAGFDGNTNELVSWFDKNGSNPTLASAFVEELRARYGSFKHAETNEALWNWRPGEEVAYTLRFAEGQVPAYVGIVMEESSTGVSARIGSIRIIDSEFGDLTFPGDNGSQSGSVVSGASTSSDQ